MSESGKVDINMIATGVPGLDLALGGGIPEYSFNIIAGDPGMGKTTLAHQILFANASPDHPALYFTLLGEPPVKMLRYQQQYRFFDLNKIDREVFFVNLSQEIVDGDLHSALEKIKREIENVRPGFVVIDSFRTLIRKGVAANSPELAMQEVIGHLAMHLTSWQATTFLVGEYAQEEAQNNPVFTIADGIIWLSQSMEHSSITRNLRILKSRGQAPIAGIHSVRIDSGGFSVYPRVLGFPAGRRLARISPDNRLATGIGGLDDMMDGGIFAGNSVMIAGPSGSGKSIMATQFIAAGLNQGQRGVIAIFEERPEQYMARCRRMGIDVDAEIQKGNLRIIYLRALDLLIDEALQQILDAVAEVEAQRVVIDSINGFEMSLAPAFRVDPRESVYRLIGALTDTGVTVMSTVEVLMSFTDVQFTSHAVSYLADDIILLRYVELDSRLEKIISVVKMRSGDHRKEFRRYVITKTGMLIGEDMNGYRGLITGVPQRIA